VKRLIPPTTDELLAIYAQGPDAMCSLVQDLCASFCALQDEFASLMAVTTDLAKQVQELKSRLAMDSHNSSKPPSSDGYKKPPRPQNLRSKSGKRPGGQKGHAGCTLEPVDKPDHHFRHVPKTCGSCGHSLDEAEVVGRDSRQVYDLPVLQMEVTEHEVVTCVCPHCQALNQGKFPENVTQPAQYGPRFMGFLTYLNQYQLIPLARTQECAGDLFGHEPSQATIVSAVVSCAKLLEPVEKSIKKSITKSKVVRFDETGMRVAKLLQWIHTASTPMLTFYYCHAKRGREAFTKIGILEKFKGTAVHDCLSSYQDPRFTCTHSLCCVHLLRELLGIWQAQHETWTQRMSALLRALKRAKESAQAAGQTALDPDLLQRYRMAYRKIVARGLIKNPAPERTGKRGHPANGKARSLLLRFEKHEEAVLRFAIDFAVPFDNNLAERDLRMVKLRQKISGCFRSDDGPKNFCTIRGYISTLRKQGIDVMAALCSVFSGNPMRPNLKPA
jgi:transposase